jgi:pimeloyl-ACP methyl ester carboxylesterase
MTALALPVLLASLGGESRDDEVAYRNGEVELAATLHLPAGEAPFPAVVIAHGSGTSDRANPWTAAYARDLAARGVAVLHPDKRGSGKSGGDWRTASLETLAGDVAAGVAWLAEQPEIDGERIGVIGFSQGGAVAAIVAATDPACRFAITISGGTQPMREQIVHELVSEARQQDAPLTAAEVDELRRLHDLAWEFARNGNGFDAFQGALTSARAASERMRTALRGLPATPDHWVWSFVRAVGDFDPLPYWQRLEKPALLVFGGQDTQVDARASEARLLDALGGASLPIGVLHFQANGHALHREDVLDLLARFVARGGAG